MSLTAQDKLVIIRLLETSRQELLSPNKETTSDMITQLKIIQELQLKLLGLGPGEWLALSREC